MTASFLFENTEVERVMNICISFFEREADAVDEDLKLRPRKLQVPAVHTDMAYDAIIVEAVVRWCSIKPVKKRLRHFIFDVRELFENKNGHLQSLRDVCLWRVMYSRAFGASV